jgi:hypothetical protein
VRPRPRPQPQAHVARHRPHLAAVPVLHFRLTIESVYACTRRFALGGDGTASTENAPAAEPTDAAAAAADLASGLEVPGEDSGKKKKKKKKKKKAP